MAVVKDFVACNEVRKDIFGKGLSLPAPLDIQWPKCFHLQGGFASLTRGSAPGPRWGLCPQTPVIGSCSHSSWCPPTTDPFCRLWSIHIHYPCLRPVFRVHGPCSRVSKYNTCVNGPCTAQSTLPVRAGFS